MNYDFSRRQRFTNDQLRALELIYEQFASRLGGTLSAYLRLNTIVSPIGLENLTYGEFLATRSETTALWSVRVEPVGSTAALDINPDAAYAIAYTMMGGRGRSTTEPRPLTEIELSLLGRVVTYILQTLGDVWRSQGALRFSVISCDTRPQMLGIASGTEPFILGNFELIVGEVKGVFTIGIPVSTIESGGLRVAQTDPSSAQDPVVAAVLNRRLARVPFVVTAQVESTIPTSDVVALRMGDVVSIDAPVTAEVDVHVADRRKYHGRLYSTPEGVRVRIERAVE